MSVCKSCESLMLTAEMLLKIKETLELIEPAIIDVHNIKNIYDFTNEDLGTLKWLMLPKLFNCVDELKKIKTTPQYYKIFNENGRLFDHEIIPIVNFINKLKVSKNANL